MGTSHMSSGEKWVHSEFNLLAKYFRKDSILALKNDVRILSILMAHSYLLFNRMQII